MDETFGARLRRRREERGVALATITEQTKIKQSLLDALERDDVSQWPSGIFRRAYVRAYAHAIGLDPDAVVREFLEVHPEPAEVIETLSAAALTPDGAWTGAAGPGRFRSLVGTAIGSFSRIRRGAGKEGAPIESPSFGARTAAPDADPDSSVVAPPRADAPVRSPHSTKATVAAPHSTKATVGPPPPSPDFLALANVCTELGRVENAEDVQRLLKQAAEILGAVGLIVWSWDPPTEQLRPVLVHGYSERVLAQLPPVKRDSDNPTAAAFRSTQPCVLSGGEGTSGALAVPILSPSGCAGVLAIELQRGAERTRPVLAAATILAALLAQLVGSAPAA